MRFIKPFEQVSLKDIPLVGGKNASLGEMIAHVSNANIRVPGGFAVTSLAYWHYLNYNQLLEPLKTLMATLHDVEDTKTLQVIGKRVRTLIEQGSMPDDLAQEIVQAYQTLSRTYAKDECDVAVRSSATAEDLPTASFAGQQETYLNICGAKQLLESCKKCFASLFTDRAIVYRVDKGFDHFKVALSIGIQKMVRSDLSCAGVAFSLDTESGFKDVIVINAAYGLGESVVKGLVNPDEYVVHKPTLMQGFVPILKKQLGQKHQKIVYTGSRRNPVKTVKVPRDQQESYALSDQEIIELSRMVMTIEQHYSALKGTWTPMDVEWAKDGSDGLLYIVQARSETVHTSEKRTVAMVHYLKETDQKVLQTKLLGTGLSIGQQIVSGKVRVIKKISEADQLRPGEILVAPMTDPDWVSVMKRAAGVITEFGGRTCHAAIVSRELGIPALVGVEKACSVLATGQVVTIDCSKGKTGFVYDGSLPYQTEEMLLTKVPTLSAAIMVNIAEPESAFSVCQLPVDGVGLARLEFIITNTVKVHPMALLHPELIKDAASVRAIKELTHGYATGQEFFVDKVAQGIGTIAGAFYPRKVIVRLSDFKSNEYRNLFGGQYFEPIEENPMLGLRGASRYCHPSYQEAFALECVAIKKVRETMGLPNVAVMVPFVRTVGEANQVAASLAQHGLERGKEGLQLVMMVEIPSNALLIDQFSELFDGFSIGSNDLTQLTLGVDRDSGLLSAIFDERDPAVMRLMEMAITGAKRNNRVIGICGQAPSDYPEIAQKLMDLGINSLSLNQDAVIPFLMRYAKSS